MKLRGLTHDQIVAAIGAAEDAGRRRTVALVINLIDNDALGMPCGPRARSLMILQQGRHLFQSAQKLELTPISPHESQRMSTPFERTERAAYFAKIEARLRFSDDRSMRKDEQRCHERTEQRNLPQGAGWRQPPKT